MVCNMVGNLNSKKKENLSKCWDNYQWSFLSLLECKLAQNKTLAAFQQRKFIAFFIAIKVLIENILSKYSF